jgi:DNA recombination protein RmuC
MFLPGEPLFSAAVQHESGLIEEAIQKRVLIATPTTLMALLSTVAHGWRQERLHKNALLLQKLGAELYERLATCTKHLDDLGRALGKAIHSYNASVGSLESRVLVTARRFQELGVPVKEEIKLLEPLEVTPRHLTGMPGEDALEAGHSAP